MRRKRSIYNLEKHRKRNSRTIKRIATGGVHINQNVIIAAVVALLVLATAFLTLNEYLLKNEALPSWSTLYRSSGLSSTGVSSSDISVHFIDVGQGDCELIKTPDCVILIDSGEKEYFSTVIDYLKSYDIKRIDYIIVTHPHSDHAGSMSYIISEFDVGKVIMPKVKDSLIPSTSTYVRLLNAISDTGTAVEYAQAGKKINISSECYFEVLSPTAEYDDLNNYSVVIRFVNMNNVFLFAGDIESEAEGDIIDSGADLSADVLKIAHHGSSTSSTKKFLKAVDARYAVIEVGSPNTYNHPNSEILDRIEVLGMTVYRTDLNGNIVFESDGNDIKIITEKENLTEAA